MRKIDYKTIPSYLELNKKEVKRKLDKEEKDFNNYEHDLEFPNNLILIMEINYNTNQWIYKNHFLSGYKIS